MSMISRGLKQELLQSAREMPVLTLTGPRQSGKTTLVRACFPDYEYVTLENPDVRREFMDDPRYFLKRYSNHIIFDEAQRTPELFSYLQEAVDRTNEPGQFVLTGSQNFLLMNTIFQFNSIWLRVSAKFSSGFTTFSSGFFTAQMMMACVSVIVAWLFTSQRSVE